LSVKEKKNNFKKDAIKSTKRPFMAIREFLKKKKA